MCLRGVSKDSCTFSFTIHSHSQPFERNSEKRAYAAKKGKAGQAEMSSLAIHRAAFIITKSLSKTAAAAFPT
jgi:hypothetical protein